MNELHKSVKRNASRYLRGVITATDFVCELFDLCAEKDPIEEETANVFLSVPEELMQTLYIQIQELERADFCLRNSRLEDSRTQEEIQAAAIARQPRLRRICGILLPLVIARLKQ